MNTIQDILNSGLLELYVMGDANEQETLQVEQWMAAYPEVRAEIQAIELSLEAYAMAHTVQPNVRVKENLLNSIASNTKPEAPVVSIQSVVAKKGFNWKMVAAAVAILFLGSAIYNGILFNKFTTAKKELSAKEQELLAIEKQNATIENAVFSSNSTPIDLKGLPKSPNSNAKIFWMKNTGDVYVSPKGLPEAPKGMQYQLWAIVGGKPVDAGMINTNNAGEKIKFQKMKSFGKAEAFAITLEVEGGNPEPKGDMYVMAKT